MAAAGRDTPCSIARELGIGTVVIPPYPGIFSAIGMLLSDAKESFKLSRICRMADADAPPSRRFSAIWNAKAANACASAGFDDADIAYSRAVEMRYVGPGVHAALAVRRRAGDVVRRLARALRDLHALRYGHAFESMPSEIVDLIVEVYGHLPKPVVKLAVNPEPAQSASSPARLLRRRGVHRMPRLPARCVGAGSTR